MELLNELLKYAYRRPKQVAIKAHNKIIKCHAITDLIMQPFWKRSCSRSIVLLSLTSCLIFVLICENFGEIKSSELISSNLPTISDPNMGVQIVFQKKFEHKGNTLSPISTMTFLGKSDILLLDKNNGTVNRIVNGVLLKEPLLDVSVANKRERGMLGIESKTQSTNGLEGAITYVYLYYTESETKDGTDICQKTYYCKSGTYPLGNHLYRYELRDNKLTNPKLLLQLPAWPALRALPLPSA